MQFCANVFRGRQPHRKMFINDTNDDEPFETNPTHTWKPDVHLLLQ